jgi:hypothetical protein
MGNYWLNKDYVSSEIDYLLSAVDFDKLDFALDQHGQMYICCYFNIDPDTNIKSIRSLGYFQDPDRMVIIRNSIGEIIEYQWVALGMVEDYSYVGQPFDVNPAGIKRYSPDEVIYIATTLTHRSQLLYYVVTKDAEVRNLRIDYFELYKHVADECVKRNIKP